MSKKCLVQYWEPGNPDYDNAIRDQQLSWLELHKGPINKYQVEISKIEIDNFIKANKRKLNNHEKQRYSENFKTQKN
jgi:hypothetical protein